MSSHAFRIPSAPHLAVSATVVALLLGTSACNSDAATPAGGSTSGKQASAQSTTTKAATTPAAQPTTTTPATPPPASPTVKPSTPTTKPTAKPAGITLNGANLGVTRDGVPFAAAVAAISRELGQPLHNPAVDVACVDADSEVVWKNFRLAETNGKVSGWVNKRSDLRTPSGVTVGTTIATLERVYKEGRLSVREPNADNGWTFTVLGVDQEGALSGGESTSTVISLFHGSCHSI